MRKLITTTAIALSLSFGIWTLAVTFTPVGSSFNAGDTLSATVFNDLFNAIDANFGAAKTAIEANESGLDAVRTPPAIRATIFDAQTTNNNQLTTISFDAELFDSDDIHDNQTDSELFTAPEDGIYQVAASVVWNFNASGGRTVGVYKNAENFPFAGDSRGAGDGAVTQTASGLVELAAGDTLSVKVFQSSGGALAVSASPSTAFSMAKIGELP